MTYEETAQEVIRLSVLLTDKVERDKDELDEYAFGDLYTASL